MVDKKYPKYVTTDSDMWNSADEAYFFVIKNKAKPFNCIITPIIEDALESGLLREATQEEINEYELEQEIEKKIRERRFEVGKTYEETKQNYFKWKESYDKTTIEISKEGKEKLKQIDKEEGLDKIDKSIIASTSTTDVEKITNKTTTTTQSLPNNTITSTSNTEVKKTLTPTENALKQKASVRTDNMN